MSLSFLVIFLIHAASFLVLLIGDDENSMNLASSLLLLHNPQCEIYKIESIYQNLEENIQNTDLIIDFTQSELQQLFLKNLFSRRKKDTFISDWLRNRKWLGILYSTKCSMRAFSNQKLFCVF